FITNALEDQPMPVYGTGQNLRDWIYVGDHCEALRRLCFAPDVVGEVWNIGGGEEHSSLEIGRLILSQLGKSESLIRHVTDRPGHDRRYALDCSKIRQRLGFVPEIKFAEGAERTVRWYAEHRDWWEKVKRGAFREYYEKAYKL
ncbi:MAG TPA: GDP-mannose 4,6-dehydratase, partial [Candidatus Udaeobacter sp.]|nr:GDP-mannose 4,6-dehydratase [Candidatus Udaeobacter sp.]